MLNQSTVSLCHLTRTCLSQAQNILNKEKTVFKYIARHKIEEKRTKILTPHINPPPSPSATHLWSQPMTVDESEYFSRAPNICFSSSRQSLSVGMCVGQRHVCRQTSHHSVIMIITASQGYPPIPLTGCHCRPEKGGAPHRWWDVGLFFKWELITKSIIISLFTREPLNNASCSLVAEQMLPKQ